jgi:hypothetical protein
MTVIEIIEGCISKGLDASIFFDFDYAFAYREALEIYYGLGRGYNVSVYAKPEFNYWQMEQIRMGYDAGVDVSRYADHNLCWQEMGKIRRALYKEKYHGSS